MKRTLLTAIGLGFALTTSAAFAQDHNDVDKRVVVHKGNETVRRTVDERPNASVERRTVTQRPNGNVVRRSVTERPNGTTVVRKAMRAPRRFHAARPWVA